MADWILTGDEFTYLADFIGSFIAYGIGLAAIAWMIGQVIAVIWSVVRF